MSAGAFLATFLPLENAACPRRRSGAERRRAPTALAALPTPRAQVSAARAVRLPCKAAAQGGQQDDPSRVSRPQRGDDGPVDERTGVEDVVLGQRCLRWRSAVDHSTAGSGSRVPAGSERTGTLCCGPERGRSKGTPISRSGSGGSGRRPWCGKGRRPAWTCQEMTACR